MRSPFQLLMLTRVALPTRERLEPTAPYYSHSPYSSSNQNQFANYNGAAALNWPANRWPAANAGHITPQPATYSSCCFQPPNTHLASVSLRGDYHGVGNNTPQWFLAKQQQHYDVSINQPNAFALPRFPPLHSEAAAVADEQDEPCALRPHLPNRYIGAAPSIQGGGPSVYSQSNKTWLSQIGKYSYINESMFVCWIRHSIMYSYFHNQYAINRSFRFPFDQLHNILFNKFFKTFKKYLITIWKDLTKICNFL